MDELAEVVEAAAAAVVVAAAAAVVVAAAAAVFPVASEPVPATGLPWSSIAWTAAKLVLIPKTALNASAAAPVLAGAALPAA